MLKEVIRLFRSEEQDAILHIKEIQIKFSLEDVREITFSILIGKIAFWLVVIAIYLNNMKLLLPKP